MAEWFFTVGDDRRGPHSVEDLKQQAKAGALTRTSLVWTEGMPEWTRAGEVRELTAIFGAVPPPLPPRTRAVPPPIPTTIPVPPQAAATRTVRKPFEHGSDAKPDNVARASNNERASSSGKVPSPTLALAFLVATAFVLGIGLQFSVSAAKGNEAAGMVAAMFLLVGIGLAIAQTVLSAIFVYRAWDCLPDRFRKLNPGLATGLLFIPLVNMVWVFLAVRGLSAQTDLALRERRIASPVSMGTALLASILFAGCTLLGWIPVLGALVVAGTFIAFGLWMVNASRGLAKLAGVPVPVKAAGALSTALIAGSLYYGLQSAKASMVKPSEMPAAYENPPQNVDPYSPQYQPVPTPQGQPAPYFDYGRHNRQEPKQAFPPSGSTRPPGQGFSSVPVQPPANQSFKCQMCGGSGRSSVQCSSCRGSGMLGSSACLACRGSRFQNCVRCGGSGQSR